MLARLLLLCNTKDAEYMIWQRCERNFWGGKAINLHVNFQEMVSTFAHVQGIISLEVIYHSLTASLLVFTALFTASLPKQKHSRTKSRQLRRLSIEWLVSQFLLNLICSSGG